MAGVIYCGGNTPLARMYSAVLRMSSQSASRAASASPLDDGGHHLRMAARSNAACQAAGADAQVEVEQRPDAQPQPFDEGGQRRHARGAIDSEVQIGVGDDGRVNVRRAAPTLAPEGGLVAAHRGPLSAAAL